MKKIKIMSYLLLIIVTAIVIIFVSLNMYKDKKANGKEKIKTEIYFLENKIVKLFNDINNIETRNYNITVSKTPNVNKEDGNTNSDEDEEENKSVESKENDNQGSKKEDVKKENGTKEELFNLERNGILTSKEEIDWETIKKEIEILNNSIPTIILDLYEDGIVEKEILKLNNEMDELTVKVKEKNKKEVLKELTDIYGYIIEFSKKAKVGELEQILIETKSKIFYAYSNLDDKNWDKIINYINESIDIYSKLLTDENIKKEKQYKIKKGYILLNELKDSIKLKDETIFLIKYKNLLEEINNM